MIEAYKYYIRNITEERRQQFPSHYSGTPSKALIHLDTTGSRQVDYRASAYQHHGLFRVAYPKVQEQVYYVFVGEDLIKTNGKCNVVRKYDVIFLSPGTGHSIQISRFGDLSFNVVKGPVVDE